MENTVRYNTLTVKKVGYDIEKEKSDLEKGMGLLAEENTELERLVREGTRAKAKLESNRKRFMELATEYADLKEEE